MTDSAPTIESYRDYLVLMARSLVGPRMRVKLDASDLVQQTLLDAHRKFDQFDGQSDQQLGAWLKQILRNNFLNAVRDLHRDKRDVRREKRIDWQRSTHDSFSRVDQWLAASGLTPSQQVSRHEQLLLLPALLNRLPDSQREAIVMYHIQGCRLNEVAQAMDRTESAVGGLLYRGLKALKESIKDFDSASIDDRATAHE